MDGSCGRLTPAKQETDKLAQKKDAAFYQGQITGARFFIRSVLPVAQARMAVIQAGDTSALDMAESAFGA